MPDRPLVERTPSPERRDPARGLRLLVAEDDPVSAILIRHLLQQLAYRAEFVTDGAAALAALAARAFDLVLMDWSMPRIDGLEATRQLRGAGSGVVIVAVSAASAEAAEAACLAAGADAFLTKPFSADALRQVIARLCPHPGGTEAVDVGQLLRQHGGDAELAFEVAGRFVTSARTLMDELPRALGSGDHERLEYLAHRLSGSLRWIGALPAAEAAAALEAATQAGGETGVRSACARLERELNAVVESVRELRERGVP